MKLRCPDCKKEEEATGCGMCEPVPIGTETIETPCPECAVDFTTESYFDKDGEQIMVT